MMVSGWRLENISEAYRVAVARDWAALSTAVVTVDVVSPAALDDPKTQALRLSAAAPRKPRVYSSRASVTEAVASAEEVKD